LPWFSTGGTRAKKYLHNPADNKTYYFKKSIDKYPFEFWSEIIAYELGKQIGLDVLKYDVAIFHNEIGCISQSMIDPDKEELIEIGKYLQAFDNTFSPEDRKLRHQYTFQLIEGALQVFDLANFIDKFLEVLVFDALIGNGDRHQENWAFIRNATTLSKSLKEIETAINNNDFEKFPGWLKKIIGYATVKKGDKSQLGPEATLVKLRAGKNLRFAPIYDSGSSLCRECTDEKIESMLKNQTELEAYLNRGVSEIHWEQEKVSHFELLKNILETQHASKLRPIIENVGKNFNTTGLENVLNTMDVNVPEEFRSVKIPEHRKKIIIKLVSLRSQKLIELVK
jgi:hypothetical protein